MKKLPDMTADEFLADLTRSRSEEGRLVYSIQELARLDGVIQALSFYEVDMVDRPTTIEGLLEDAKKIARYINPDA